MGDGKGGKKLRAIQDGGANVRACGGKVSAAQLLLLPGRFSLRVAAALAPRRHPGQPGNSVGTGS